MRTRTIDVDERLPLLQSIPLSLQHLFAMFGATVLALTARDGRLFGRPAPAAPSRTRR